MSLDTVLLVTLWGNKNYGNKLQAIALKRLIENNGFGVVCARYHECDRLTRIKRRIIEILGCIGYKRYKREYLESIREKALMKDSDTYLSPMTSLIKNYNTVTEIRENEYIGAVVGSDQVWHRWTKSTSELPYFYLSFFPPHKRIAYAASFGFDEFPDDDMETHKIGLQGMQCISCREETGCNLVEKAISRSADLVLDPTLCVERSFWENIEKEPSISIPNRYILKFFLGKDSEYDRFIKEFSSIGGCEIVDLFDINNKSVWGIGIGSFLWIIHHAELVCTDSFHCSVFSIVFERPLQVFKRKSNSKKNMFNRIETLLKITNLEECRFNGVELQMPSSDFKIAKDRLNVEREKSIKWISKSLDSLYE